MIKRIKCISLVLIFLIYAVTPIYHAHATDMFQEPDTIFILIDPYMTIPADAIALISSLLVAAGIIASTDELTFIAEFLFDRLDGAGTFLVNYYASSFTTLYNSFENVMFRGIEMSRNSLDSIFHSMQDVLIDYVVDTGVVGTTPTLRIPIDTGGNTGGGTSPPLANLTDIHLGNIITGDSVLPVINFNNLSTHHANIVDGWGGTAVSNPGYTNALMQVISESVIFMDNVYTSNTFIYNAGTMMESISIQLFRNGMHFRISVDAHNADNAIVSPVGFILGQGQVSPNLFQLTHADIRTSRITGQRELVFTHMGTSTSILATMPEGFVPVTYDGYTTIQLAPANIVTNMPAAQAVIDGILGTADVLGVYVPYLVGDLIGAVPSAIIIPNPIIIGLPDAGGFMAILQAILNAVLGFPALMNQMINYIRAIPAAIALAVVGTMQFDFSKIRNTNLDFATIFPFSIPFDFYLAINSLNVSPVIPVFEIDFSGTIFGSTVFRLDFSDFEDIAQIIRWGIWISFFMGLMLVTNKLIRW